MTWKNQIRSPDVLVRVRTKNGQDQLLLCHLEVQTKADKNLEERMFRYAVRIYHYFNQMPVGILIMADPSKTFRPTQYRYTEPHTGLITTYDFLLFKTADWIDRIDEIKESKDLVDQVIYLYLQFQQAQKKQWSTRKNRETRIDLNHQKLEFKKRLFTHLVSLGMDQTEVRDVLLFIDWMVILPRALEEQYFSHRNQLIEQKEGAMAWMSTFERVSHREGKRIGKEEGKLEFAQEHVIKLLNRKFGLTQEETDVIMECQDRHLLEMALEQLLFAKTKEEILAMLQVQDA